MKNPRWLFGLCKRVSDGCKNVVKLFFALKRIHRVTVRLIRIKCYAEFVGIDLNIRQVFFVMRLYGNTLYIFKPIDMNLDPPHPDRCKIDF